MDKRILVQLITILFIVSLLFSIGMCVGSKVAKADSTTDMADSIEIMCDFMDESISIDKREKCMLYYLRCAYGTDGKNADWTDKKLLKCVKEKGEL